MTEEEWFAADDVLGMLAWLGPRAGDRKLRLFACACLRVLGDALPWETQECIKYVEKYADGLLRWADTGRRVMSRTMIPEPPFGRWLPSCLLAVDAGAAASETVFWAGIAVRYGIDWPGWTAARRGLAADAVATAESDTSPFCPVLRDIFGNPFRPVVFDPAWRTSTVVALARGMYEARDFGPMPVLADALQDAGCEDPGVLGHCRDPRAAHVRGCWVVDLVLNKA